MQTDFCIAFLCQFDVVVHGHEYDPLIEGFWISSAQIPLNMLLDVKCGSTWKYTPCELHLSGCAVHMSSKSVFVPYLTHIVAQLLDGSGFEPPIHDVESENARTFILINFAGGSLSSIINS